MENVEQGWDELRRGHWRVATAHFAAAARAAPDDPQAREGLLEALQSHSRLYRLLQRLGLRVGDSKRGRGRLSRGWLTYLAPALTLSAGKAVRDVPEVGVALWPFVGLLWILVVIVYIIHLRAILLASRSEYSKLALGPHDTFAVVCAGSTLFVTLVLAGAYLVVGHLVLLITALMTFFMVDPVRTAVRTPPCRTRTIMGVCLTIMAGSLIMGVAVLGTGTEGKHMDEKLPATAAWPLLGYLSAGLVFYALSGWREEMRGKKPKPSGDRPARETGPHVAAAPAPRYTARPVSGTPPAEDSQPPEEDEEPLPDRLFIDPTTRASHPGRIKLSLTRLRWFHPEAFGVRKLVFRLIRPEVWSSAKNARESLRQHLLYGDSRAAVVVATKPFLVAAYSDDIDCVAVLRFDDSLAKAYGLRDGDRLLTVNTYFEDGELGKDLIPGPDAEGVWHNFWPVIADFLTDKRSPVEARKNEISEDEWATAREYGERYIRRPNFRPRDGRPFLSHFSAGFFD